MSKTVLKQEQPQALTFCFEAQSCHNQVSSEEKEQSRPNTHYQFLTQDGNYYFMDPPNYESDRHALYLLFGTRSSRHTCNNYQQDWVANDILPTLCDLVDISRHLSEYHSIQRSCLSSPEKISSQQQCLKVSIQLNDKKNKKDERLKFLEGDVVKGYITISNFSKHKLPYTACLVSLVGCISVKSQKKFNILHKKKIIHRFLSMVDYDASNSLSNYGDVGSLFTSHKENSSSLNERRKIYIDPSTSRRESFKFKLPKHLANCACQMHNLQQHCELLPTFDFHRNSSSKIKTWFKKGLGSLMNDSFEIKGVGSSDSEASITYNIEAKVIGEISDYQEYLYCKYRAIENKVLKRLINIDKANITISVLSTTNLALLDQGLFGDECKEIYNNLVERAKKIQDSKNNEINTEKESSTCKRQQLYIPNNGLIPITTHKSDESKMKNGSISKDLLLSLQTSLGTINIKIPDMLLNISSSPPYVFPDVDKINPPQYTMRIPINLEFTPSSLEKVHHFPNVRNMSLELVALTFMSRTLPIPIAISHDILFGKKKITDDKAYDPFEEQIKKPFRSLFLNINFDSVKREDFQLLLDIKSIACLEHEYERIFVPNLEEKLSGEVSKVISSSMWKPSISRDHKHFKKTVNIDICAIELKRTLKMLHWVPEFQSCFMGRLYFSKINLKMKNNSHDILIYIPLKIMRSEDNR